MRGRPPKPAEPVSAAAEAFLEMMAAERGAADNTLAAYRRDLADAEAFLKRRRATLPDAATEDLRAYLKRLDGQGMSARTAARRLSALRQFYRHRLGDGHRADDPTEAIDGPRQGRPLPKSLGESDVARLIETAARRATPAGLRLAAALELLYATGMRVSELVALPLAALAREPQAMLVRGKGDKERLVPLGEPARLAVRAYLAVRERFLPGKPGAKGRKRDSPYLFPSGGASGHLTRHRLGQLLKALAAEAGQLELNVMMPVIAHNLFEMMHLTINALQAFTEKCVQGVSANREKAEHWLHNNPILITALNPIIGYVAGAALVKEAQERGIPIRDLALEKAAQGALHHLETRQPVSPEEILAVFSELRHLTEGGIAGN